MWEEGGVGNLPVSTTLYFPPIAFHPHLSPLSFLCLSPIVCNTSLVFLAFILITPNLKDLAAKKV